MFVWIINTFLTFRIDWMAACNSVTFPATDILLYSPNYWIINVFWNFHIRTARFDAHFWIVSAIWMVHCDCKSDFRLFGRCELTRKLSEQTQWRRTWYSLPARHTYMMVVQMLFYMNLLSADPDCSFTFNVRFDMRICLSAASSRPNFPHFGRYENATFIPSIEFTVKWFVHGYAQRIKD